jgi:hypothetical protein
MEDEFEDAVNANTPKFSDVDVDTVLSMLDDTNYHFIKDVLKDAFNSLNLEKLKTQ